MRFSLLGFRFESFAVCLSFACRKKEDGAESAVRIWYPWVITVMVESSGPGGLSALVGVFPKLRELNRNLTLLTARELWASPAERELHYHAEKTRGREERGEIPGREPPNGGIMNAIWRKRRKRLADSSTTEGKRAIIRRAQFSVR